jgi:prepilin-type processing-associated H-X9-DG protein
MRDYVERTPGGAVLTGDGRVSPCEVTGAVPYSYIGWALPLPLMRKADPADVMANVAALAPVWRVSPESARRVADSDWPFVRPIDGQAMAYRLRDGVERFYITDINAPAAAAIAASGLPVMWDAVAPGARMFNHVPGGCNVLYMDGHVTFQRWNGGRPGDGAFPVDAVGVALHKANHMLNGTTMRGM